MDGFSPRCTTKTSLSADLEIDVLELIFKVKGGLKYVILTKNDISVKP